MRLENQVAIVTGAGRGLGRAVAELFAAEDAAVVAVSLEAEEVAATVAALQEAGGRAAGVVGDVSEPETADEAVRTALEQYGRLDILVNNAGVFQTTDFLETPQAGWQPSFDVIVQGALHCSRACARAMVDAGRGGRIVNVSSVNGFLGADRSTAYCCAKGALDQLTRALAVELAPHGILVNGVAPGFMDTRMAVVDGVNELETPLFREFYAGQRRIPLARAAKPDEVAPAILFLALPTNTYITGHTLVVDGGLSITF